MATNLPNNNLDPGFYWYTSPGEKQTIVEVCPGPKGELYWMRIGSSFKRAMREMTGTLGNKVKR